MSSPNLAFGADLHLRNWRAWGGEMVSGINNRARITLDVLRRALAAAKEHSATGFALLGDTFDQHNPSPQLVAALASVLTGSGLEIHLLVGNHDATSEEPGDHALAPLVHVPHCHVYDQPTIVGNVLFAPFRKASVKTWLPDLLQHGQRRGATTLAAHFGLITEITPDFLQGAPDAISADTLHEMLAEYGFTRAVLGNWHNQVCSVLRGTIIQQCGTLCPHSFGDPPGGRFWPTVGDTCALGVHAPEFITMDASSMPHLPAGVASLHNASSSHMFLRVKNVLPDQEAKLREVLANCGFTGWELEFVAGQGYSLASAIGNAHKTRTELLTEYVANALHDETPATREAVHGKLVEYKVL